MSCAIFCSLPEWSKLTAPQHTRVCVKHMHALICYVPSRYGIKGQLVLSSGATDSQAAIMLACFVLAFGMLNSLQTTM